MGCDWPGAGPTINLKIIVEYGALTTGVVGILFAIGYPIRRILDDRVGRLAAIPAPLIGLAIIQVVTQYWYQAGGQGAAVPAYGLLLIGVLATAVTFGLDRRRQRSPDVSRLKVSGLAAALAAMIVLVNFGALFHLTYLTTASDGNSDAASYAVAAQHLVHHGFGQTGNIAGTDLGHVAETNGFGSTTMLASLSAVLHKPVWKLTMPSLFVLMGLVLYSLALLLFELLGGRELVAVVAAAAACCTLLFIYVAGQYFLGQVMAMAAAPLLAVVALRAANLARSDWAATARLAATTSFVLLVMMSHFFHMAVLGPPILVPPAVLAASGSLRVQPLLRRLWATVMTMGTGALAAAALVPRWLSIGWQQTKTAGSANVGWPLPTFWPVELVGFLRHVTPRTTAARLGWSLFIVAVFGLALAAIRRKDTPLVRYAFGFTCLATASYVVLIVTGGGVAYRQWKWITFFQPVLATVFIVVVALAIVDLARARASQIASSVAVAAIAIYGLAVSTNVGRPPVTTIGNIPVVLMSSAMRGSQPPYYVTEDLARLRGTGAPTKPADLDLALPAGWDTMWGAYFLDKQHLYLQNPSYYPVAPSKANFTLLPNTPGLSLPGARPFNGDYQLALTPRGPTSAHGDGLMGEISSLGALSQDAGHPTTVRLRIRNTGASVWLSTASPVGSVGVGVHLDDPNGSILAFDWLHHPLIDSALGVTLPPGSEISLDLPLPSLSPGDYVAQVGLLSENVGWFGPTVSIPLHIS